MSAISGQGYTFSVTFFSQATGSLLLNPTITAADFEVSTDGGAYTALASTPTVTPAGSYNVEVTLTSAEVGTSNHSVKMIDASGSEWKSLVYHETVGDAADLKADVSGLATALALGIVDGKCTSTLTNTSQIISTGSTGPWTTGSSSGGSSPAVLSAEITTIKLEAELVQ